MDLPIQGTSTMDYLRYYSLNDKYGRGIPGLILHHLLMNGSTETGNLPLLCCLCHVMLTNLDVHAILSKFLNIFFRFCALQLENPVRSTERAQWKLYT